MSLAETLRAPDTDTVTAVPGSWWRLLRSELRLVFGRRRNLVVLAGLAAVPLLLGIVLFVTKDSALGGQGPGFVGQVTSNGLFLPIASLFLCLPFLLPLTVSIVAGDTVAGEASAGTLRYLLVVPVPRTRLLAVKAVAAVLYAVAAVATITLVALVVGAALFGLSDLALLSGSTVPLSAGLARVAGIAGYVAVSLTGLVAVGMFFSTLTEVPIGAIVATVAVAIVSSVLDSLPQLHAIHPGLLTHHWFDFAEFLRIQVDWGVLGQGIAVQAAWVAVLGALAWSRFTTADVSS